MVFHYHLQNEEVVIALRGRLTLRTFDERELTEGDWSPAFAGKLARTASRTEPPSLSACCSSGS